MKLWIHQGNGHYVGSICVVLADTKEDAEALVSAQLISSGLTNELPDVTEYKRKNNTVVYFDDGDY